MLDFVLALATVATTAAPIVSKKKEEVVVLSRNQTASTEHPVDLASVLLSTSVTTYQVEPPISESDHYNYPAARSFAVTAVVEVGGRVVQAPIDDEDIIYFDE